MVEGQFPSQWDSYTLNFLQQTADGSIVSQTSRSSYIMYPYLISVYGLGAGEFIRRYGRKPARNTN